MVVKKSSQQAKGHDYLAYASLVVIVLALLYFSFGAKITGHVTDTATVNVTIDSTAAINFTVDSLNFGSGGVTTGKPYATINSEGTVTDGSWSPTNQNLTLENIGNRNVTLYLSAGMTAAAYLGGKDPLYQFKFNNAEAGSCVNASATNVWINTSTGEGVYLCSNFLAEESKDSINIGVQLVIPSDSMTGLRSDTWTATATAI
jgi:hypothetical protein